MIMIIPRYIYIYWVVYSPIDQGFEHCEQLLGEVPRVAYEITKI
jgi:hypothetical protein